MERKKNKKSARPISPCRLMVYGAIIFLSILTFESQWILKKRQAKQELCNEVQDLILLATKQKSRDAINRQWHSTYKPAAFDLLQQQIGRLSFLQRERESLATLINHSAFFGNRELENRLAFLTSGQNKFLFKELGSETGPRIQETLYLQTNVVQMDGSDLFALLEIMDSPTLLISDFSMKRKKIPQGSEVFEVNVQIIKRERIEDEIKK